MDLTTLAIVKKLQNKNNNSSNENNNNNSNNIFVVNFIDGGGRNGNFTNLIADKTRDEIEAAMHDGYVVVGSFIYDQDNLFMACYHNFINYGTGTYSIQFNNRGFNLPPDGAPTT